MIEKITLEEVIAQGKQKAKTAPEAVTIIMRSNMPDFTPINAYYLGVYMGAKIQANDFAADCMRIDAAISDKYVKGE